MKRPLVSVIIASYNHAPFIEDAITSVLNQTYANLELIVEDDYSTDESRQILKRLRGSDPRLKVILAKQNHGTVETINHLIGLTKGDYLAILGSDDTWREDKLEIQMNYLENHPQLGAVFSCANIIDEQNMPYNDDESFSASIFKPENMSQGKRLRSFFQSGNHLCHPSSLIPMSVVQEIGLLNPVYHQLHDFDYWIRLVNRYNIHIIDQPLINYRRLKSKKFHQLSGNSNNSKIRTLNEQNLITKNLLNTITDQNFKTGFSDLFIKKGRLSHLDLLCEKFFILANHPIVDINNKLSAFEFLIECNEHTEIISALAKNYHYTLKDLYTLSGTIFKQYPETILREMPPFKAITHENAVLKKQNSEYLSSLEKIYHSKSWKLISLVQNLKGKITHEKR